MSTGQASNCPLVPRLVRCEFLTSRYHQQENRDCWFEEKKINWSEITEGIVTGIVLAAALGLLRAIWEKQRKSKQIQYIRSLLIERESIIRAEQDLPLKEIYYNNFLRDLETALSERCDSFSYDEITSIRKFRPILRQTRLPYDPKKDQFTCDFTTVRFNY